MSRGEFNVTAVLRAGRVVIAVRGEVDLATAPDVIELVAAVIAGGSQELVLDLRAVTFMDSSGVHMLESVRDRRPEGVRCSMVDGVPPVARVLEITERTDVLPRSDPME